MLTVWVVACDLYRQAAEALRTADLIAPTPNGQIMPSPYLAIANRQAAMMLRIGEQLGFSPTSRARLRTGAPGPSPAERDDGTPSLADYLANKPAALSPD